MKRALFLQSVAAAAATYAGFTGIGEGGSRDTLEQCVERPSLGATLDLKVAKRSAESQRPSAARFTRDRTDR